MQASGVLTLVILLVVIVLIAGVSALVYRYTYGIRSFISRWFPGLW